MRNEHIIVVFLFVSALLISVFQAAASASGETGFRSIHWGSDLSTHTDMRRISCDDTWCSHVRSMEDLSMGEALLNSVTYRSMKGRFVEVIIEAPVEAELGKKAGSNSENFLAFKRICHEHFGKTSFAAMFENIHAEQYRWEYTNIHKILKVNFNKNHMELTITDHDLLKRLKDEKSDAPAKSGQDVAEPCIDDKSLDEKMPEGKDTSADAADMSSGEENEKTKGSPVVKKTGKFLKWLFVTDNPGGEDGPSEEIRH